jgi:hypothetical protein
MTVTAPLPAAPEPYLATGPLPATPGTVKETGRRHRVVAVGSGLSRRTTMKALKHANVDTPDTLGFLMRITARGAAHVHTQTSLWLHVVPMTAAALTTAGMLVTLCIAIIRERRSTDALDSVDRRCYETCSAAGHSVVTDVCGVPSGVGEVGTDHAIHRIA